MINILRSSGKVADFARSLIEAAGVPLPGTHGSKVVPDWIPLDTNLHILEQIGRAFGDAALLEIGASVPEHALFPPHVDGVSPALQSLDVAYHLNHRRDGVVMYEPATRTTLEGIGHYRLRDLDAHGVVCHSTSMYPCPFDLGLVTGLARRFEPGAAVRHAAGDLCRGRGAEACAYVVSW